MRILVTSTLYITERRGWEELTVNSLRELGNEVYHARTLEENRVPWRPDVIFSTTNPKLAYKYSLKYKKPFVCWLIAGYPTDASKDLEEAVTRADLLLAVSETAREDFLNSFPGRTQRVDVAYHGVLDGRQWSNEEEDQRERAFSFVGMPDDKRKRFEWFAEAVDLARAGAKVIAPEVFRVEESRHLLPMQSEVVMEVEERRKFELLAQTLAIVMTSSWETWWLPGAEAASIKLPIISFDLPVMHELWDNVPLYFRDVDECTWWMLELLEEPKLGKELGERLRKIFDDRGYNSISCARRLQSCFEEVV